MRKPVLAILMLVLIGVVYFVIFKRPASVAGTGDSNSSTATISKESGALHNAATPRSKWSKPNRPGEPEETNPAPKAIVYGPTEFSRGELQNIVIEGGIRLGNSASFVPRFNPKYRLFGNYISPEEEIQTPFDSATINFKVAGLNNNEANFEIRTRDSNGAWSEWKEVSPHSMKEPVSFGTKAVAWQYRVVLFANDSASSPIVESISIEPTTLR